MPSSYSTNLKIELQATGENSGTWGNITNTNLGTALEQAIVGYGNPSYSSDANLTLTYTDTNAAQAARALVLNVTSAVSLSATRELVVPTIQKQYIVQNNTTGAQSITVKTSGGTGITVPNGRKAHLYVNGTDVIYMDDYVDINGGAIDGTTIGANSAAAGTFTTVGATTGNITTVNATTVDTTNVEVTNVKAKDGTAAIAIADSTGAVTVSSGSTLNGGVVINEPGADVDFRVESDTDANCLFVDASANNVGIGTSSPAAKLQISSGTGGDTTGLRITRTDAGGGDWRIWSTATANSEGAGKLIFGTSSNFMTLDGSGNLGIGTSSPFAKLQVVASSADYFNPQLMIGEASNSTGKQLHVGYNTTANTGYIQAVHNGTGYKDLLLQPNGGNLGLGVTPSAWSTLVPALQIGGGGSFIAAQGNSVDALYMGTNAHFDGTNWKYKISQQASYYLQNDGIHSWHTAASGTAGNNITFTQAMTLDASGRLLVGGTTAPSGTSAKFSVVGGSASTQSSAMQFTYNGGTFGGALLGAIEQGGGLQFYTFTGNVGSESYTERARITSDGNFYVNTTGAGGKFYVVSDLTANNGLRVDVPASFTANAIALVSATAAGTGWNFLAGESSGGSSRIQIRGDGNVYNANGTYGTISDARLKQDIVDAGSQWDDLKAIRFRKYRMKSDVEADPNAPALFGVVAQELEQVCPGLVDDGEIKTVKSSILLMKAAKALQEAMARIEKLEAEVAALKGV